jgi:hypothetical protein
MYRLDLTLFQIHHFNISIDLIRFDFLKHFNIFLVWSGLTLKNISISSWSNQVWLCGIFWVPDSTFNISLVWPGLTLWHSALLSRSTRSRGSSRVFRWCRCRREDPLEHSWKFEIIVLSIFLDFFSYSIHSFYQFLYTLFKDTPRG